MLRRKTEQLHSEEQNRTPAESVVIFRNRLKRRGLTLGVALALLIGVLIAGTVAWYTQLSNITGMTMKAAKIDIRANYVDQDDIVLLQAGDYLNSKNAGPGTRGILPIRMDAPNSDSAIDYTLSLNFDAMADEFKNRLRFYYYLEKNGTTYEVTIDPATAATVDSVISGNLPIDGVNYEYLYWEWVYELDDDWFCHDGVWYYKGVDTSGPQRVNYKMVPKTTVSLADHPGIGTPAGLFDELYSNTPYSPGNPEDPEDFPPDEEYDENDPNATPRSKAIDAFDEFDSIIGLGEAEETLACKVNNQSKTFVKDLDAASAVAKLPAYQQAMMVKLYVTGTQAEPLHGTNEQGASSGTTGSIFRSAS